MLRDSVTCPACARPVTIISVQMPAAADGSRGATGSVLKRCPSCCKWAWMTPQTQEAT